MTRHVHSVQLDQVTQFGLGKWFCQ